jgi:hypothetical protein
LGAEGGRGKTLGPFVGGRGGSEIDSVNVLWHVGRQGVDADRLSKGRVSTGTSLVSGDVEPGRTAEGVTDDRVEVRRRSLPA